MDINEHDRMSSQEAEAFSLNDKTYCNAENQVYLKNE